MNLHKIFQYLVNNDNFLVDVEIVSSQPERKATLIADIITDVNELEPGVIEPYEEMSKQLKCYLNESYSRYGIMAVIEKSSRMVNISFLVCLDMLLKQETSYSAVNDVSELEAYLSHSIMANCQIDKVKNTSKVKTINKKIQASFMEGDFTNEVLSRIVDILEINLVIFDFDRGINTTYWSHGIKYPTVNPFRRLYAMCHYKGDYTPLISTSEDYSLVYGAIMSDNEMEFYPDLKLGMYSLPYINTWDISGSQWCKIIKRFFPQTSCDVEEYVDRILTKC